MSSLHQQAINYVYQQVLQKLQCHYTHRQRLGLELLIHRILDGASNCEHLGHFRLMVVHDGSRDSTLAVTMLRAAQLSLAVRQPHTFTLRVVVCRHSPLSEPLLGNLHRLYAALFVHDDERVELLLADAHQVVPFSPPDTALEPLSPQQRLNLLMAGQLTGCDVRATFCHGDYRRHTRAVQRAVAWGEPVDALAVSSGAAQRDQYLSWSRRFAQGARRLQQQRPPEIPLPLRQALAELSGMLGSIPVPAPRLAKVQMHDLLADGEAASATMLEFLGFRLPDLTCAFAEADYASPLLMAHLCGLRSETLTLLEYRDGIEAYLALATPVLGGRLLPEALLRGALAGYASVAAISRHRKRANALVQARYGVSETQLVCMLFAPFVDQGAGLPRYLQHCHPRLPLALPYLHNALRGQPVPGEVVKWLTDTSGLPMAHLQRLYLLGRVHVDDDHTLLARSRLWPTSARGLRGLHPVTGLPAEANGSPAHG